MAVIGRVTVAVTLWLIAFVVADLQVPSAEDERADVSVPATVDAPAAGSAVTRDATVTNERPDTVVLAAAAATPGDAGPGCPASLVARAVPRHAVEVPPGATVDVPVQVRVDRDVPAVCRGEAWPVELAASAITTGDPGVPDDARGLLPYVAATAGVLLLGGAALGVVTALGRRRPTTADPARGIGAAGDHRSSATRDREHVERR